MNKYKEKKPDDLYLNIKPSNPVDWCFDKKNLLVLMDDNFKGIVGENVTQEQVGEITKLLTKPAPQYKVGDWVEWHEGLGITYQSQITRISHSAVYSKGICIPLKIITRKLKPSEILIRIGCLSGTVERRTYFDTDKFFSLKNPEMEMAAAVINIDALDTPTRELVESLLKAQEEE